MPSLKKIRVVLALELFILVAVIFLDITGRIPTSLTKLLGSLQIIPSIARLVSGLTAASLGVVVVMLLTLTYGRLYCSTLCPLGTLQDIVIRLSGRMKRRRWYRYKRAPLLIQYSILAFSTVAALMGSMLLVDLLEPFSNFGRILSNLADPVLVIANNGAAFLFRRLGVLALYNVPLLHVQTAAVLFALAFLLLVVYLSYRHGRLFCNLLCPAGALLGIISRFSAFKISIIGDRCTDCGFCEMVCKANCIDAESRTIDFHACVGCFNCIDACPPLALRYEPAWKMKPKPVEVPADAPRRAFLGAVVATGASFVLPADTSGIQPPHTPSFDQSRGMPITPPGSRSKDRFSNLCTACHLCISACPPQVLYPSIFEYGVSGILQPKMNYSAGYCSYECVRCTQVCPSGAILPLDVAAKKEIQLGKSVFVKDDCIVVTKKKDCGACSEHCPTKAVKMVPYDEKLLLPELNNDICVGCGACEHACPTTPRKAIYVVANAVHLKAKKPQVEKLENPLETQKDFPF